MRNCCHLVMASNDDWVAPVGLDDRRFVILDVSEKRKGDAEYFKQLAEHIKRGGDKAFLRYLLKHGISDFDPRRLPDLGLNQATKRDAKIRGADSVTQWWVHCLEAAEIQLDGVYRGGDGQWGSAPSPVFGPGNLVSGWDDGLVQVPTQLLYDAYSDWAGKSRQHIEHSASMGKKLKELAGIKSSRPSVAQDPNRRRVYVPPCLSECRKQFEKKVKMPWGWDDEVGDITDEVGFENVDDQLKSTISIGLAPERAFVAAQRQAERRAS